MALLVGCKVSILIGLLVSFDILPTESETSIAHIIVVAKDGLHM